MIKLGNFIHGQKAKEINLQQLVYIESTMKDIGKLQMKIVKWLLPNYV